MMAGMMITMSIFSDVSVNAQDISTDAFDAVDAILSDDSADSSSDESSESADGGSDESSESTDSSSDESSESADSSSDESAESADGSSNESAENAESTDSSNDESLENTDESADNTEDNASDSTEDNTDADNTEDEDNTDVDKTEDNNSSSSSSSSSEEPEEATTEAETEAEESTEATTEAVEESTEESTEAEESTEITTEAAENDQNSEENTEATTEAEESTEATTAVVEEPLEATGEDLLGGAIDEKDEARDIAINKSIVVYTGVDSSNTSKTKPNSDAGGEITATLELPLTITGHDNDKLKWDPVETGDNSGCSKVEVGNYTGGGDTVSSYDGSNVTVKVKNGADTAASTEYTFIANLYDATSGDKTVGEVAKIRVIVKKSEVDASEIADNGSTNDDQVETVAGASDYTTLKYSSGLVSHLSINVDKDIAKIGSDANVTWGVYKEAACTNASSDVIGIDSASNGSFGNSVSAAPTSDSLSTIYLKANSVGTAYLRATVGGVIIYQGRIDVTGATTSLVAANQTAYDQGVAHIEFSSPAVSSSSNLTWEIEPETGAFTAGNIGTSDITGDGVTFTPLNSDTGGVYTINADKDKAISGNTCNLYLQLGDNTTSCLADADNKPTGVITITGKINGVALYKVNLKVNKKPTFSDADTPATGETGIDDKEVKIGGTVKLEMSNKADVPGDLEWKIYGKFDSTNKKVDATTLVSDTTGGIILADAEEGIADKTTATITESDGVVYFHAKKGTAKITSYYVQATSSGVPVYIAKVGVMPEEVAHPADNKVQDIAKGKTFTASFTPSGITPDSGIGKNSLKWKIQSYDKATGNADTPTNKATDYFHFVVNEIENSGDNLDVPLKAAPTTVTLKAIAPTKGTDGSTPFDKVVKLTASVNGVVLYECQLTAYDVQQDITDSGITVPTEPVQTFISKADEKGTEIKTQALPTKYAGQKVKWQIYKDSGFKQPADAVDISSGAICAKIGASDTAADDATNRMLKLETEIGADGVAKVYAFSAEKIGSAYIQGTLNDVVVYKGIIRASDKQVKATNITIYAGDTETLTVGSSHGIPANTEGEVEWQLVDNTDKVLTGSDLSNSKIRFGSETSAVANKVTNIDKTKGEATIDIKGSAATGGAEHIVAIYNGAIIYRADVTIVNKPTSITASAKEDTAFSSQDIASATTPKLKAKPVDDNIAEEINISGLGAVEGTGIKWVVKKGTVSSNTFTPDANAEAEAKNIVEVNETDSTTAINKEGKATLKLNIKKGTVGYVRVYGYSTKDKAATTELCKFDVEVTQDASTITKKDFTIYSNANSKKHTFTANLKSGLFNGKTLTWALKNANDDNAFSGATVVTAESSTTALGKDGEIKLVLTETNQNTAFRAIATADGMTVCEFTVTPSQLSSVSETPAALSVSNKIPTKLTATIDGTKYPDNNIYWKVLDENQADATNANTKIKLSSTFNMNTTPDGAKATLITPITDGNKNYTICAYSTGKVGSGYVVAVVDDEIIYKAKVSIGKEVEPVETRTIYANAEEEIKIPLGAATGNAFSAGDTINWTNTKSSGTPNTGELIFNGTGNAGDGGNSTVEKDESENLYTTIKVKATAKTTADNILEGKIDGSLVYKMIIKAEELPAASGSDNTLVVNIDGKTETADATSGQYKITKTLDDADINKITLSGLGSVVGKKVTWELSNNLVANVGDNISSITGGNNFETDIISGTTNLYVKTNTIGPVTLTAKIGEATICAIAIQVNPSANSSDGAKGDIYKHYNAAPAENGTYKFSTTVDIGTSSPLNFAAGKQISWKIYKDANTDITSSTPPIAIQTGESTSSFAASDGNDEQKVDVDVFIKTTSDIATYSEGKVYANAYVTIDGGTEVNVASFEITVNDTPDLTTNPTTVNLSMTGSTAAQKVQLPTAVPASITTNAPCVWQLYQSDGNTAINDVTNSIVMIGKNVSGGNINFVDGEDGVSITDPGCGAGGLSPIYIQVNDKNLQTGSVVLMASVLGVPVYKANVTVGMGTVTAATEEINIYKGEVYEFKTENALPLKGTVNWKQTSDGSTTSNKHGVNGLTGASAQTFNTETDGDGKTGFEIAASGTAADKGIFVATMNGTEVYKVTVNSIEPTAIADITAPDGSGTDILKTADDNSRYIELSADGTVNAITIDNLAITENEIIDWTIQSKTGGKAETGGTTFAANAGDSNAANVFATTSTIVNSDTDGKGKTTIFLRTPLLGTSKLIGKVGNTKVAEFNVVSKPSATTLEDLDREVYLNASNVELKTTDKSENETQLDAMAAILGDGKAITWECVDSSKNDASAKVICDTTATTATISKTSGKLDPIKYVIKNLTTSGSDAVSAGDKFTITAYVDGDLEIYRFQITVKANPKVKLPEDKGEKGLHKNKDNPTGYEANVTGDLEVTDLDLSEKDVDSGKNIIRWRLVTGTPTPDSTPDDDKDTATYTPVAALDAKSPIKLKGTSADGMSLITEVASDKKTTVPVEYLYPGTSYIEGYIKSGDAEVIVKRLKVVVYNADSETLNKTIIFNSDPAKTLSVDKDSAGEALTAGAKITWVSGTYASDGKDLENVDIVAIEDETNHSSTGLSRLKKAAATVDSKEVSTITVKTKRIGNGYIKALDESMHEICRYNISVINQPKAEEKDVEMTAYGDTATQTYNISNLPAIEDEDINSITFTAYESNGTTALNNGEFIFNADASTSTSGDNVQNFPAVTDANGANTATVGTSAKSITFKATKKAAKGYEDGEYIIKAKLGEIEIAKINVTVKPVKLGADEITELAFPQGTEQEIKFSIAGLTGFSPTDDKVTWVIGEVKNKSEKEKADVIGISTTKGSSGSSSSISSGDTTAEILAGNATSNMCTAYITLNKGIENGKVSGVYFIKGILNGKEIYKAYITPTEKVTANPADIPTDTVEYSVGSEEKITPKAAGNKLIIGELEVTVDATTGAKTFKEGEKSNSVLQFDNKKAETTVTAGEGGAINDVIVKAIKEGNAYIKEVKQDATGDEVVKKWYITAVKPEVSDIRIGSTQLQSSSKNGLVKVSDKTTIAADEGNGISARYKLKLYKAGDVTEDKNLVSKSLSEFVLNAEVIDGDGKVVKASEAIGNKELVYSYEAGDAGTGKCAEFVPNGDGTYTIKATKATTAGNPDVLSIETIGKKTTEPTVPIKKIAIEIEVVDITAVSSVNSSKGVAAEKGYTTVDASNKSFATSTTTVTTLTPKVISAGDILRVKFDGTYLSAAKVEDVDDSSDTIERKPDDSGIIEEMPAAFDAKKLPDGKWILCANPFTKDASSNSKTSSAAKLSGSGSSVYLTNTKAKGSEGNQVYLRYVSPYDSNIVYAQVPIVIVPTKATELDVTANGIKGSILTAAMGGKYTLKVKAIGGSNKNIQYGFTAAPGSSDSDAPDEVKNGTIIAAADAPKYVQINDKGIIVPLRPTGKDGGGKTQYVKLVVASTESDIEEYVYIKVEPNVKSIVLSQTSISVANNNRQSVVLRLNPAYGGSDAEIKVNAASGPFKLYYEKADGSEDEVSGSIPVTNGIVNLFVEMDGSDTKLTKENNYIEFRYVKEDENGSSSDDPQVTKVKAAKLTVKRAATVNNVSSVTKLSESFPAALGVPVDLKTVVKPGTALNIIDWTVEAEDGTTTITEGTDYTITNGWFIPLRNIDFKISGETEGLDANGGKTEVEYTIDVYKPISSLTLGTGYEIYNGYLKNSADTSGKLSFDGGTAINLTIQDSGQAINEPIVWSSNNPVGLTVVGGTTTTAGDKVDIYPNKEGTYTVTGVAQYSKQKFSFKVNVNKKFDSTVVDAEAGDFESGAASVTFNILQKGETGAGTALSDTTAKVLTKGKTAQILAQSSSVAFENISFASSDTKHLTVNSSGVITPKLETDDTVYVIVKMSGKIDDKEVTIEKEYPFTITSPEVTLSNKNNYIKNDYLVTNKNYTFSAKVSGISSKNVKIDWKVAKAASDAQEAKDATYSLIGEDEIDNATATISANNAKITFDNKNSAGKYFIYPVIKNTEDEVLITEDDNYITDSAQVFYVVGNTIKTVTLSNKSIETTATADKDADKKYSYLYISAFADDGKDVDLSGITWTSSNQSVAKVISTDSNIVGSKTPGDNTNPFYYGVKIETGHITGTANISGVLNNSGKKVTAKITVLPEDKAVELDPSTDLIKVNNNSAITIKRTNGTGVKQAATTFVQVGEKTKKTVVPANAITTEKWFITPIKSAKDKTPKGTAYDVTLTRDADTGSITVNYNSVAAADADIKVDVSGNLIAKKAGYYLLKKEVTLDDGSTFTMGTTKVKDAEGNETNEDVTVLVTVK